MHKIVGSACLALLIAPSFTSAAEVHKDVQNALSYSLPEISCNAPAGSAASQDPHKLGRFERAQKRWLKCVKKYKKGLMKDFEELKGSAKHGLTEEQAKAILANMSSIQAAVESPTGMAQSESLLDGS